MFIIFVLIINTANIKQNFLIKKLFYLKLKVIFASTLKLNIMTTLKLTPEQYLKAIKLGYYEPIKCISAFVKVVKHYKVCGRTEELLIDLKN